MEQPKYHIFVCSSFRLKGEPQGVCFKKGAPDLMGLLENGIIERDLSAQVTATGCLKVCDRGPAMVVYPAGWWYGGVDEDAIEEILDAMENDQPAEDYLIA